MVLFGQVVVGPPGAGKTTYCHGMNMFVKELGRTCCIINLDFANDRLPYEPTVDVRDLISLQDAMEEHKLGPNGGLMYCVEYLLENIDWLVDKLKSLETNYAIFDCPGQVELYTHHTGFKQILEKITKELNCRLCSVHLVDSFYCCQPATFISAVLLVTCTMLRLGLPHVNVLTKIDLVKMYGPLPFNLDFFTECTNLAPLVRYIDGDIPASGKPSATTAADDEKESKGEGYGSDGGGGSGGGAVPDEEDDYYTEVVVENGDRDEPGGVGSEPGAGVGSSGEGKGASGQRTGSGCPHQGSSCGGSAAGKKRPSRDSLKERFRRMSAALCEVVDDYGLVSFHPMNVEDAETVGRVLAATDNANGFSLAAYEATEWARQKRSGGGGGDGVSGGASNQPSNYDLFKLAASNLESSYSYNLDIQEKYGLL